MWLPWGFVLVYTVLLVCCFPVAVLLEPIAGARYDLAQGTAAAVIAKALGASIAFYFGRSLFKETVGTRICRSRRYKVMQGGASEWGWKYALLVRLTRHRAFINSYGLAVSSIAFPAYIIPTAFAAAPMSFHNVLWGALYTRLREKQYALDARGFGLFVATLAAVTFVMYIVRYHARRLEMKLASYLRADAQTDASEEREVPSDSHVSNTTEDSDVHASQVRHNTASELLQEGLSDPTPPAMNTRRRVATMQREVTPVKA